MCKKMLSVLMALVITVGLASCGSSTTAPTPAGAGTSSTKPSPAGQLPIVEPGEDISLNICVLQIPDIADYKTNYFTRWLEEKSGINLTFTEIPQETALEKVLLTLSTNDVASLPDIYVTTAVSNHNPIFGPSYASRWYEQGMIIPLNDLIDEYGYHFQESLAKAESYGYEIKKWMTSPDGNIYSLPSFSASLTNSYPVKLWVNQGWLKAVGKEMPTTTEEFKDVLLAFKNNDPNGNGKADEIPLAGARDKSSGYFYGYNFLINSFIYNDINNSRMYVENGTVKFAPTTDEWREAMKYLRDLCKSGLFYEGSFTQDLTALQQMSMDENDILGVFEGMGYDLVAVTKDQDIIDRWDSGQALTGPNGAHYVTWAAPGIRPGGIITTKCKYPEVAFRLLDLMMSDEGSKITRYGEKGVNWDDADPGTISYYGNPAVIKILENTWGQVGQNQNMSQRSPYILDPIIAKGVQWGGNEKESGYIKAKAVMKLDETGVVPDEFLANLVFTTEEAESIQMPRNDIDSYILQSIANFAAGDWDPSDDARWNSYVAEYEKMGLSTYLKTVQDCYTRMRNF